MGSFISFLIVVLTVVLSIAGDKKKRAAKSNQTGAQRELQRQQMQKMAGQAQEQVKKVWQAAMQSTNNRTMPNQQMNSSNTVPRKNNTNQSWPNYSNWEESVDEREQSFEPVKSRPIQKTPVKQATVQTTLETDNGFSDIDPMNTDTYGMGMIGTDMALSPLMKEVQDLIVTGYSYELPVLIDFQAEQSRLLNTAQYN